MRLFPKGAVATVIKSGISPKGLFYHIRERSNRGGENRYSVVVSSKVSKKAHERNLLKRRAREILRKIQKEKGLMGWDIAILFKQTVSRLSFTELEREIKTALTVFTRHETNRY